jgi:hypothetical protein
MAESGFLPDGYEVPASGGKYFKLKTGENRLRILSKPLLGYVGWTQEGNRNKPVRKPLNQFAIGEIDKRGSKHFWAMPVWDYADGSIKVWELTQKTIMGAIQALSVNKKWGNPVHYDLSITAKGDGMDREYSVLPEPRERAAPEIVSAWVALRETFDLTKLFTGGDPFGDESPIDDDEDPWETDLRETSPMPRDRRPSVGVAMAAEKSSAAVIEGAMAEPVVEPEESPPAQDGPTLTLFIAECVALEKRTGRKLWKESPKGSHAFWFVDQDIIDRTLVDDEQPGAVLIQRDGQMVADPGRFQRLYSEVLRLSLIEKERTA